LSFILSFGRLSLSSFHFLIFAAKRSVSFTLLSSGTPAYRAFAAFSEILSDSSVTISIPTPFSSSKPAASFFFISRRISAALIAWSSASKQSSMSEAELMHSEPAHRRPQNDFQETEMEKSDKLPSHPYIRNPHRI
jgi:hypothetical protein